MKVKEDILIKIEYRLLVYINITLSGAPRTVELHSFIRLLSDGDQTANVKH